MFLDLFRAINGIKRIDLLLSSHLRWYVLQWVFTSWKFLEAIDTHWHPLKSIDQVISSKHAENHQGFKKGMDFSPMLKRCTCKCKKHEMLSGIGTDQKRGFKTAMASAYPIRFCQCAAPLLAQLWSTMPSCLMLFSSDMMSQCFKCVNGCKWYDIAIQTMPNYAKV